MVGQFNLVAVVLLKIVILLITLLIMVVQFDLVVVVLLKIVILLTIKQLSVMVVLFFSI